MRAFKNLKQEILDAMVTSIDEDVPFTVETDASDFAMAGMLSQRGARWLSLPGHSTARDQA